MGRSCCLGLMGQVNNSRLGFEVQPQSQSSNHPSIPDCKKLLKASLFKIVSGSNLMF